MTGMKKIRKVAFTFAISTMLWSAAPSYSLAQENEHGRDGDQPTKTSQTDNEDQETTLDWVGFFGLAGIVGIIGPRSRRDRIDAAGRKVMILATVLTASATLSLISPSMAQQATTPTATQ